MSARSPSNPVEFVAQYLLDHKDAGGKGGKKDKDD